MDYITALPRNTYGELDDDYNENTASDTHENTNDYSYLDDVKRGNIHESIIKIDKPMEIEYVNHSKEIILV